MTLRIVGGTDGYGENVVPLVPRRPTSESREIDDISVDTILSTLQIISGVLHEEDYNHVIKQLGLSCKYEQKMMQRLAELYNLCQRHTDNGEDLEDIWVEERENHNLINLSDQHLKNYILDAGLVLQQNRPDYCIAIYLEWFDRRTS